MRDYSAHSDRGPEDIRSDASANRKAIILAARQLFAADQHDVSLTEIAKAAGVSRATLYRNFQDKSSIILEVFHYNLDLLEAYAKRLEGQDDRFYKLMQAIIEQQAKYQALATRVKQMDEKMMDRVYAIFERPIEEAKESGRLRPDFDDQKDLLLLIMMISGALLPPNDVDGAAAAQRALQLVVEGIR
ncbi:MAG: TetR/AcrR family transcriptional regulator [Phaeodactylibacter sp.]|nr:TetR/AcrR family transcriptional regulator [Phaeodactylibacter sp.]